MDLLDPARKPDRWLHLLLLLCSSGCSHTCVDWTCCRINSSWSHLGSVPPCVCVEKITVPSARANSLEGSCFRRAGKQWLVNTNNKAPRYVTAVSCGPCPLFGNVFLGANVANDTFHFRTATRHESLCCC